MFIYCVDELQESTTNFEEDQPIRWANHQTTYFSQPTAERLNFRYPNFLKTHKIQGKSVQFRRGLEVGLSKKVLLHI
jgi:hypothetical protein